MSLKPPDESTLPTSSFVDVLREAPLNIEYPEFGGRGNDLDDNTAALARVSEKAAESGGKVFFPPGSYKFDGWQLEPHVAVEGVWKYEDEAQAGESGTVLKHTGTGPAITFPNSGLGGYSQVAAVSLRGVGIYAPDGDGIYVPNGGIGVQLENVYVEHGGIGVHLRGFRQDWRVDTVRLQGNGTADWGWFDDGQPGVGGDESRDDDGRYAYIYVGGVLNHGILWRPVNSANCVWTLPRAVFSGKHGMVWGGGIVGSTLISPNFEANGNEGAGFGSTLIPATTGSITSASSVLTVASGTGLVNGKTVVVEGAGGGGLDLVTTISSGGGTTTLTLAAPAGRSVSGADVKAALWSDFYMGPDVGPQGPGGHATHGGAPYGNTIISPNWGIELPYHNVRYAADLSGGFGNLVISGAAAQRPLYDPYFANVVVGAEDLAGLPTVKCRPSRGWVTVTNGTGWTGSVKARRVGKVVEMYGKLQAGPAATGTVLSVPPWMGSNGSRLVERTIGGLIGGNLAVAYASVASSGALVSNQYADGTVLYFDGFRYSVDA